MNSRETVDKAARHEDRQYLHEGGEDADEAVHQQRGDQHSLAALGVGEASPEVGAEHHP